jgi:hypothetical protein
MLAHPLSKLICTVGAALSLAVLMVTPSPTSASASTSNAKVHVYKIDPNAVPRYKPQPVPPCDPSLKLNTQALCQAVSLPAIKSGH